MLARYVLGAMTAILVASAAGQPQGKPPKQSVPRAPGSAAVPTTVVSNSLGIIIQRGTEQGVEVSEEGRGWVIRDGETTLKNTELVTRGKPVDIHLQVNRFFATPDCNVVKVDVSPEIRPDAFTKALSGADKSERLVLLDTLGRKYEAVGYLYQDQAITRIRYTKGAPLKGLSDAPSVSRSTPDRHLTFVFSVSLGVQIKEFRIGDTVLETYSPPITCDQTQK